jgi:putative lipase involved disintegration of autophagic bodies
LQSEYPNATFTITGHSLGGGLAAIVGQRLRIPYISFSGPGSALAQPKLGVDPDAEYVGITIIPDYDVVPRIDVQVGDVQQINCLGTTNVIGCHSIQRTCCELVRKCGEATGRTLKACPAFLAADRLIHE